MPEDRIKDIQNALAGSKKKFEWAYLLDSFRQEREREMTLDTTRAIIRLGGRSYECIDVPGHKELIKNMLTGASEARFAIVVIDIREGITPQTLRHLKIAKFLGIEKIIIAVNKCDLTKYVENEFTKLRKKIFEKAELVGYRTVHVIPIAAFFGDNVTIRSKKMTWYSGPTLGEVMTTFLVTPTVRTHKDVAIGIQDVCNRIIMGKIFIGQVKIHDTLTTVPRGEKIIVQKLWVGKSTVNTASVPAPVSMSGNGMKNVRRGDVLVKGHSVYFTNNMKATCVFIKSPSKKISIDANFNTSKAKIVGALKRFKPVVIEIILQKKIPILDTFIIRQNSEIIGMGRILRESHMHR